MVQLDIALGYCLIRHHIRTRKYSGNVNDIKDETLVYRANYYSYPSVLYARSDICVVWC